MSGAGNIKREEVKKLIYAGCGKVMLNGSKHSNRDLLEEVSLRFGKEKMLVSLTNVDFLFKTKDVLEDHVHELVIYDRTLLNSIESITNVPYIVDVDSYNFKDVIDLLKSDKIRGICGSFINDTQTDIMQVKCELSDAGIKMDNFEPKLAWSDLKVNADGLVPVIAQDYKTQARFSCLPI